MRGLPCGSGPAAGRMPGGETAPVLGSFGRSRSGHAFPAFGTRHWGQKITPKAGLPGVWGLYGAAPDFDAALSCILAAARHAPPGRDRDLRARLVPSFISRMGRRMP